MDNSTWKTKVDTYGIGCVATRVIEGVVEVKFPANGYDFSSDERDDMFLDNVAIEG